MDHKKGDILRASNRSWSAGYHPIIFLEQLDDDDFIGAILTHSTHYIDNVLLRKEYFNIDPGCSGSNDGDSLLVKTKLLKPRQWGPFQKIGSLTPTGIQFVEATLRGKVPVEWGTYLAADSQGAAD